jgi:biotin-dependent carboxylase-like uncharacterized protein
MSNIFFEILRPGTNTTVQDSGRNNLSHIGVTVSGAMDQRNYKISNALVSNSIDNAVIEFAYQGPLLKLKNGSINFAITGDVNFNIIKNNNEVQKGECYQNYILNNEDQIDIISTQKSVYGYLAVEGSFNVEKIWNSYSINTKANIGPNNGKKYSINEKIFVKGSNEKFNKEKKINYKKSLNNIIRVMKGPHFNYFSDMSKFIFFNEEYSVTNLSDRMGMRLKGPNLENLINTNIKSEGLVKGVIQVPADGNPIILLSDHGTIGGYPKIANVISADLDKVAQLVPRSNIKFKEVNLVEAENSFKDYLTDTNKYLNECN